MSFKKLYGQRKYQEILDQLEKEDLRSIPVTEQVDRIYYKTCSLVKLGHNEKALQVINRARKQFTIIQDKIDHLKLLIANFYALQSLEWYEDASILHLECDAIVSSLTKRERETGLEWLALYYNIQGISYFHKSEFTSAFESYNRSLELYKRLDEPIDILRPILNIGNLSFIIGKVDQSLELLQYGLTIAKKYDQSWAISEMLIMIVWIFMRKGNVDIALKHAQSAFNLIEKTGAIRELVGVLNCLGWAYRAKGELDKSLEYLLRGLTLQEEMGSQIAIGHLLNNIGYVYWLKNDLNKALDYHQRSLTLREELKVDMDIVESLSNLILVSVDQQDYKQARVYLNQIQKLQELHSEVYYRVHSLYFEALILKQSGRMKDKARAQNLFEDIINEEDELLGFKYEAMIQLCELLLEEMKSFGDPRALEEAKNLAHQLYSLSRNEPTYIIEILLLESKFAIIEGDFQKAFNYLEEAQLITEERNLTHLNLRVQKEQEILKKELDNWRELFKRNAPLQERLEQAKVTEYIIEAKKMATFRQSPSS
ncbi:MAG: tetratricopeptide repeat protein [Candidatus Thorarchaeota archaeon]